MGSSESKSLQPTVWRTCRVLANSRRLLILKLLVKRGEHSVGQVADALRLSRPVASQYLRALNARGLLQIRRQGRWVYYRIGADEHVPSAPRLVETIRHSLHRAGESTEQLQHLLTGFTHPRRVEIVRCLAGQSLNQRELASRTRISRQALSRHLDNLCARGIVEKDKGNYRCSCPAHPMARTLMELTAMP